MSRPRGVTASQSHCGVICCGQWDQPKANAHSPLPSDEHVQEVLVLFLLGCSRPVTLVASSRERWGIFSWEPSKSATETGSPILVLPHLPGLKPSGGGWEDSLWAGAACVASGSSSGSSLLCAQTSPWPGPRASLEDTPWKAVSKSCGEGAWKSLPPGGRGRWGLPGARCR